MRKPIREGDAVEIVYLALREPATVEAIEDGGRTVIVVADDGEVLRFRLAASGHFVTADHGCRLAPARDA